METPNGIYASGSAPLTFTNDGSITSVRGPAVEAGGGGIFTNTGTIQSGNDGMKLTGASTVNNSGTIGSTGTGRSIAFSGASTHTLNLLTGSALTGNVQGGTGTDNLVLQGTGTESTAKFLSFETLSMQGDDWTLTDSGTFTTSTAVNSGVLRVDVDGELTSPAITVAAGATLVNNGTVSSNSLINDGTVEMQGGTLATTGSGIGEGTIVDSGALFNQTGGTHTANNLVVGNRSDGTATYVLSGGQVTVDGLMYVGLGHDDYPTSGAPNGLFQQSGGTVAATQMFIGGDGSDTSSHYGAGRYELSDGTVTNSLTRVGELGTGVVQQTGGTFNAGQLQLGNSGFFSVDNGSGPDFYSTGVYDLLGGQLNTTGTDVGQYGLGTINQSGSSEHNVSGDLVVGVLPTAIDAPTGQANGGVYNLESGTLAVEGNSIVGAGNNDGVNFSGAPGATGTFIQTGGEHRVTGDLIVGQEGTEAGGTGSYRISDGTLEVSGTLMLSQNNGAVGGNATFTQDGGVVSVSGLDQQGYNGASSVYSLNAGTLNSGGGSMTDASVFNQAGGTHNAGGFIIGNGGGSDYNTVYNLTGAGAVANFDELIVGGFGIGILNQSAGTLNVSDASGGMRVGTGPNLDPDRRYGQYNLSGGAINNGGSLIVGSGNGVDQDPGFSGEPGGLGSFAQTDGDHHVGGNLVLGQSGNVAGGTGTYTLSAGSLQVTGNTSIGGSGLPDGLVDGTGTFNHSGGTFTTDGDMTVGVGVGTGTYNLSGTAVLNTGITYLGAPGSTFNQDGGTHNTGYLNIYGGQYNLQSGTIDVAANMGVGHLFNNASFTQTGGNVNVDGTFGLSVGGDATNGTTGTYTLDSGSLTIDATTRIGSNGVGTFNQNGGVHTTGHLVLGENAAGSGTYNLAGGTLNDDAIVGDAGVGVFNNSGGTHNVTGDLILGNQSTGNGTYNLNGGNLNVTGSVTVQAAPGSTGTLNIAGGALEAASVTNNGTVNYSAGSVALGGSTGTLANNAGGQVNFSGSGTRVVTGNLDNAGAVTLDTAAQVSVLNNNGGTIDLKTNNLTVTKDYTNTGFGTGNSFDAHANVSGSGQILAAGATPSTAQTLAGDITPTPTSGDATMNFGNLRVGSSSTLNYQIGNANTGGPTLVGAIQTSVNGGNLSDARLSGAGVTASNWGSLPGSNTGNLGVTFDATTAGALDGQQVHIRNNFDNTNSQNLAITGAAYNEAVGSAVSPVQVANQRVGGSNSAALAVTNTAAAGSFSEDLNAGIVGTSGAVTGSGAILGRLADTNNTGSGAISVGVDTSSAGAKTGSVTVNYQTAGTVNGVSNGLGLADANAPQVVNVSGNVYKAASGAILTPAFSFGTLQVGQTVSQNLVVRNTASGPAGFVEDLGAGFGAVTGNGLATIVGSGAFSTITAGNDSTSTPGIMKVGVTGTTAGNFTGSIAVNYYSMGSVNGQVVNGLGTIAVGSESYGVNGIISAGANVINQASPVINNAQPISLGNVRVGDTSPTAFVSLTNQATTAPQAALNATISGSGPITASGAVNLLDPGQTNSSGLQVGMNTSTAGAVSGTATLGLVSDASNIGGCGSNCQMNLASKDVEVTGGVYQVAQSALPDAIDLGATRINGSLTGTVNVTNTQDANAVGFQEGLNVNVASANGATASGSINNLAAGSTNNTSISVGLNTGTAGNLTGTVTLGLQSNGTGTSGLATLDLANSGPISVTGQVFQTAVAQVNGPATVDFGIVHVGDTVTGKNVSVTNAAPVAALNDVLQGSISANGAFTAQGNLGAGLAANVTDDTSLMLGLDTSSAGSFAGNALLSFQSHDDTLTDLVLGTQSVALTAQVYNYADADLWGSLTSQGNDLFTLDFGNLFMGMGAASRSFSLMNAAFGLADLLKGTFDLASAGLFSFSGGTGVTGLGAGGSQSFGLTFDPTALGSFSGMIVFNGFGYNASGYEDNQVLTLNLVANVMDGASVPEPSSLALMLIALIALLGVRRRTITLH